MKTDLDIRPCINQELYNSRVAVIRGQMESSPAIIVFLIDVIFSLKKIRLNTGAVSLCALLQLRCRQSLQPMGLTPFLKRRELTRSKVKRLRFIMRLEISKAI